MRRLLLLLMILIPMPAWAQVSPTGTISTAGADCSTATNCVGWSAVGLESFGVHIEVAASGTFVYEVSQNATLLTNGTWVGIDDSEGAASATADGAFYFANSGFTMFRVRASAISGAAAITQARGYGGSAGGTAEITGEIMVDITGFATEAKQDVQITSLGTLATQASLASAVTALQALDNAVAGNEFQVDVLTMPSVAVTNAGTFVVQVSGDAIDRLTDIDDNTDGLEGFVDGVEALLATINTAVQLIDDAVYVDDADWTALTTKHLLTGCIYQTSEGSITDGDSGPFRCNVNGALKTQPKLLDSGGDDLTLNAANAIRVISVDSAGSYAANTGERYISAGSTEDENEICAAACSLVSIEVSNNHASANAFLKCSNLTAANTTPGSSTIVYDLLVPFGLTVTDFPEMALSTALTCWLVLGEADSDVAEVAANDLRYVVRTR